jgi:glycosyltransferase involved in cell wall biosynthesis
MSKIKATVSITTYNHEKYIAQAIDSVLVQCTNFDYEIIIGEDDSTDKTRSIVKEYKKRYPDKIRLFLNDRKNVIYINGRPTGRWNFINNLKQATGQYIALLDGDDYWTSPDKLQKQADFLDSHPDFSICFHNVDLIYEEHPSISHPFYMLHPNCPNTQVKPKPVSTLEDLLKGNFLQSSAVMFRANLFNEFPDWYYTLDRGDWPLHILNAKHGNIFYSDEVMAKYRVHSGGIYSSKNKIDQLKGALHVASTIDKHFNYQFHTILSRTKARYLAEIIDLSHADGDYLKILYLLKFIFKYRVASIRDITVLTRLFNWYFPRVYRLISNML